MGPHRWLIFWFLFIWHGVWRFYSIGKNKGRTTLHGGNGRSLQSHAGGHQGFSSFSTLWFSSYNLEFVLIPHTFSHPFLVWPNLDPLHESLWNVRVGIFRVCPVRLWRHDNLSLWSLGAFVLLIKTLFPQFVTFSYNTLEFLVICIMVLFDSMLKNSETRMIQGDNIQHERTPCPPFYPVLLVCSSIVPY
jgi:hypothetical protein